LFIKCCNPECEAPFNYREGRLIRFASNPNKGNPTAIKSVIQHFWLCGKCAELYVFEYGSGTAVRLKPREPEFSEERLCRSVSAA
jgi:hypothetical protein